MSDLVDSEEAAALADAARQGGAEGGDARVSVVAPRDFTEPRTLSAERIAHIHKTLSAREQTIANALAGPLRGHPTITIGGITEVNAHGLFDGFVRPFLVHGFQCAGSQGWVIWETDAARIASDTVLSGPPTEEDLAEAASTREPILTRTERRVIGALLDEMIQRVTVEFDLDVGPGSLWQEPEELTTIEDLGPDADARRLCVHIAFEPESGEPSDIRIYLPGITAAADHETSGPMEEAPAHLAGMDLEVSVHVGGTDVPLAELLAIEIGDVIPLDTRIGDLAEIEIEEMICARGRIGTHRGLLALHVHEICDMPTGTSPTPDTSASAGT